MKRDLLVRSARRKDARHRVVKAVALKVVETKVEPKAVELKVVELKVVSGCHVCQSFLPWMRTAMVKSRQPRLPMQSQP